jgi:hypothetical protein
MLLPRAPLPTLTGPVPFDFQPVALLLLTCPLRIEQSQDLRACPSVIDQLVNVAAGRGAEAT